MFNNVKFNLNFKYKKTIRNEQKVLASAAFSDWKREHCHVIILLVDFYLFLDSTKGISQG